MNSFLIYNIYSVKKIMFLVILACIPGIFTKCYFFGIGTLIEILFSVIISLLMEFIVLKVFFKKNKITFQDNSAILTAVLFGVSIPSLLPFWIIIIGLFFSIIVAKNLYGGIGQNIFNPAMVGYAVLLISFPVYMNNWHANHTSSFLNDVKKSFNSIFYRNNFTDIYSEHLNVSPDSFTEATPLNDFKIKNHFKNNHISESPVLKNKKISFTYSAKYINISFLLGGIFLLFKRIICWRIPISFLVSLGLFSSVTYIYSKDFFMSPFFHFFSGGTMICAFFIATDPVTTSCTKTGKIIFGTIIGSLVWIIRNYSDYPDSISFSVLFANMIVPLIDHYTKTSGYGHDNI